MLKLNEHTKYGNYIPYNPLTMRCQQWEENEGHPEILALLHCILVLFLLCPGGGGFINTSKLNICVTITIVKNETHSLFKTSTCHLTQKIVLCV